MDLSKFIIPETEGYGVAKARQRAIQFLSGLTDDSRINNHQWETLVTIADYIRQTEFTDDSDYIPGQMKLDRLDSFPSALKRDVLNYFGRSNWIVKAHIEDYCKSRQVAA